MHITPLLTLLATLLLPLTTTAARNQPTSFCKCICYTNSTIIPLNAPPSESTSPDRALRLRSPEDFQDTEPKTPPHHHKLSCADCNRAFCRSYNLPICKDTPENAMFSECFQRDSLKDEMVVFIFVFATAGLLGWAMVKPWVTRLREGGLGGVAAGISRVGRQPQRAAGSDTGGYTTLDEDNAYGEGEAQTNHSQSRSYAGDG